MLLEQIDALRGTIDRQGEMIGSLVEMMQMMQMMRAEKERGGVDSTRTPRMPEWTSGQRADGEQD